MAGEPAVSRKFSCAGFTQPTGIVVAIPHAGGAQELAGLTATSLAAHFLPTLPAKVAPATQSQPEPMLLAQIVLAAPLVRSWVVIPPTSVSNVLLTTRELISWPIWPCTRKPNTCHPLPFMEWVKTLFSSVSPP